MDSEGHDHPGASSDEQVLLFVGGVPGKVTRDELLSYFLQYGDVVSVKLSKARKKKVSAHGQDKTGNHLVQGHAYVKMQDPQVARRLIEMQELPLEQNRSLHIEEAVAKSEKKKYKQEVQRLRVFLGSLPPSLDVETLKHHFGMFGTVKKLYKIFDHAEQVEKDFGYVIFEHAESVAHVVRYEYHRVNGRVIRVAPFVTRDQLNSSKAGYPYSDQNLKEIQIFDPARMKIVGQLMSKYGRKMHSHEASEADCGSYNLSQRSPLGARSSGNSSEGQLSRRDCQPDGFVFKEKGLQRSIVEEWARHDKPVKVSHSSRFSASKSLNLQYQAQNHALRPFEKEAVDLTYSARDTYAINLNLEGKHRAGKRNSVLGDLTIVEETRNRNQHPHRLDLNESLLDQSAENYRLNILARAKSQIPQLVQTIKQTESPITFISTLKRSDVGSIERAEFPTNLPKSLGVFKSIGLDPPKD